jgi:hypothetical protein
VAFILDGIALGHKVLFAGLRALLGTNGRSVTITKASKPVRRLLGVLGWEDLPGLVLEEAR